MQSQSSALAGQKLPNLWSAIHLKVPACCAPSLPHTHTHVSKQTLTSMTWRAYTYGRRDDGRKFPQRGRSRLRFGSSFWPRAWRRTRSSLRHNLWLRSAERSARERSRRSGTRRRLQGATEACVGNRGTALRWPAAPGRPGAPGGGACNTTDPDDEWGRARRRERPGSMLPRWQAMRRAQHVTLCKGASRTSVSPPRILHAPMRQEISLNDDGSLSSGMSGVNSWRLSVERVSKKRRMSVG